MRNWTMTIVTSYDWESDTFTHHNGENPTRQIWRDAVAEIAEKAKVTLPECNGRVDSAVKIVLNGDVKLLPEGKAKVASQSHGTTLYHIVNGECSCKDYAKAPSHWCKHVRLVHPKLAIELEDGWERRQLLTNSITMWVRDPLRGVRYKHIPQGSD